MQKNLKKFSNKIYKRQLFKKAQIVQTQKEQYSS